MGPQRSRGRLNCPHSPLTRVRVSSENFARRVHGKVPHEKIGMSAVVVHAIDAHGLVSSPDDANALEALAEGRQAEGLREEIPLVDLGVHFLQVVILGVEYLVEEPEVDPLGPLEIPEGQAVALGDGADAGGVVLHHVDVDVLAHEPHKKLLHGDALLSKTRREADSLGLTSVAARAGLPLTAPAHWKAVGAGLEFHPAS